MTRLRNPSCFCINQTIPWLAVLSLLVVSPLSGTERMTRFVAYPGGKASIKGSCDIHDFDIQGKEIDGEAEFDAEFLAANYTTVTPGKIPARIQGFIPVRSLHYGTGGGVMDKVVRYHLKVEAHPRIEFRFKELTLKAAPNTNGAPFVFDGQGELVVVGVTNQISMPVQVLPLGDNKLKLLGTTTARMTDYGISPPLFRGNQPIKYRDEVKLSVEWLVGGEPKAARKGKL